MTIPYLMNCAHSGDGWCMSCVKKQGEDLEYANDRVRDPEAELEAESQVLQRSHPIGKVKGIGLREVSAATSDVCRWHRRLDVLARLMLRSSLDARSRLEQLSDDEGDTNK